MRTVEERFWQRVDRRGDDECWPWLGATGTGYGIFTINGKNGQAHRFVYELLVGPIPDGLVLDHICHNEDKDCSGGLSCPHRLCVNPAHLEAVTERENILRGKGLAARQATQTHCKRGHAFDDLNTYISPQGSRICRACMRIYDRRRRAEVRAA